MSCGIVELMTILAADAYMKPLHRRTSRTSHDWLSNRFIKSVPIMEWLDPQESQQRIEILDIVLFV